MDMDRAVSEMRHAEEDVKRAFAAVEDAKQTLQRAAVRLLLDRSDDEDAIRELIRRLYWEVPQVPVKALEVAVGTKDASSRAGARDPGVVRDRTSR